MPAHRNCFTFMRVCPPYLGSKSLFQCTPFPQRIQPEVLRAALRLRFGGVFGIVLHQLAAEFQGVLSPSPPAAGRGPRSISFRWAEVNPAQLRRTRGAGCRRVGGVRPRALPLCLSRGGLGVVLHQLAPEFQGVLSPSPPAAGRGPRSISFRWAEVNPAQLRRTRGAGCRRVGGVRPRALPLCLSRGGLGVVLHQLAAEFQGVLPLF